MQEQQRKTNWGAIVVAVIATFVLYYVLESIFLAIGGPPDARILCLPVAAVVAFWLLWSRIRTSSAPPKSG